ncbi:MAG: hypothetical protein EOO04_35390, partial [Chitinophagaceae bacterium]
MSSEKPEQPEKSKKSEEPGQQQSKIRQGQQIVFETGESFAREMDRRDPLKEFRQQFIIPTRDNREQVYFLGNSLGLQPRSA